MTTNTSRKVCSPLDEQIRELEEQHKKAMIVCNEWDHHVHEDFNGYGCFAILNMHAYHCNVARGFGKANDETNYQNHLARDKDGTWLQTAMHWVELSLHLSNIHKQIMKLRTERGDFTPKKRRNKSTKKARENISDL